MKTLSKKRRFAVLPALVISIGLLVAVAAVADPPSNPSSGQITTVEARSDARFPAATPVDQGSPTADQFAVLARKGPPPDSRSSALVQSIIDAQDLGAAGLGTEVSAADGSRIAVVPVEGDRACLADGMLGTCGELSSALKGQLLAMASCLPGTPDGYTHLFGLAPDGVTQVTVGVGKQETTSTPVVDNIYSVSVAGVPSEVSWRGADGTAVETALPGNPSMSDCGQ